MLDTGSMTALCVAGGSAVMRGLGLLGQTHCSMRMMTGNSATGHAMQCGGRALKAAAHPWVQDRRQQRGCEPMHSLSTCTRGCRHSLHLSPLLQHTAAVRVQQTRCLVERIWEREGICQCVNLQWILAVWLSVQLLFCSMPQACG